MSAVDEIKVAALKRELAAGIEDFGRDRFQTYSDANLMQLAEDIGRFGRIRLNVLRSARWIAAKVHGKK